MVFSATFKNISVISWSVLLVYGGLDLHPLNIRVQLIMISFWCKLMQNENKLSGIHYRLVFHYDFRWISHIRSVFDRTGLGYIFTNQIQINLKPLLLNVVEINICRYDFPILKSRLEANSMRHSKQNFGSKQISKLRTSNCKMQIETGRWQNISREDRICHLCRDEVGDEYHYLFLCKK